MLWGLQVAISHEEEKVEEMVVAVAMRGETELEDTGKQHEVKLI